MFPWQMTKFPVKPDADHVKITGFVLLMSCGSEDANLVVINPSNYWLEPSCEICCNFAQAQVVSFNLQSCYYDKKLRRIS